jgi:hypothetical protein
MNEEATPLCPIPGLGHCVAERCNFWDPDQGCLGQGLCFDAEPAPEYTDPETFRENMILGCYEDPD